MDVDFAGLDPPKSISSNLTHGYEHQAAYLIPRVTPPPNKLAELTHTCMPASAHDKGGRRGSEGVSFLWIWILEC